MFRTGSLGSRIRANKYRIALVLIAVVVGTAACSSSTSQPNASKAKPSTTNVENLAAARAAVKQLESTPTFSPPNAPFHLKNVSGRTIMVIPFIPIAECQHESKDLSAVAASKGVKTDIYSNNGTPSSWQAGVQEAITQHDAAIVLVCSDPALISSSLKNAENNKIPVVMTTYADNSVPTPSYLSAVTNVPLPTMANGIVESMIDTLQGKTLHVLFLDSTSVTGDAVTAPLFLSAMHRLCGAKCTVDSENIPATLWGSPQLTSEVSAALTSHPNINAVFDLYSGMITETIPALTSVNTSSSRNIHVWTYAGNIDTPHEIASTHGLVEADITFGNGWLADATMDQVFRLLSGLKPVIDPPVNTPVRLLDYADITTSLASSNLGFGTAYEKGFQSLWIGQ